MRIADKVLNTREYREVTLKRASGDLKIKVFSFPLGLKQAFNKLIPKPLPPVTSTNTGSTPNYNDPLWQKAIEDYNDLEKYFQLWIVTKDDETIKYDNTPVNQASLSALREEIISSGLSPGDYNNIITAAVAAGNITEEDVTEAKKGF